MHDTILLVDDETLVLDFLYQIMDLFTEDYDLLAAHNGTTALALLAQRPVALVITDLRMPDMDGVTLAAAIKAYAPQCPIILMTGFPPLRSSSAPMRRGWSTFSPSPSALTSLPHWCGRRFDSNVPTDLRCRHGARDTRGEPGTHVHAPRSVSPRLPSSEARRQVWLFVSADQRTRRALLQAWWLPETLSARRNQAGGPRHHTRVARHPRYDHGCMSSKPRALSRYRAMLGLAALLGGQAPSATDHLPVEIRC